MFAMKAGTEMFGNAADKLGGVTMAASGLAVGIDALTSSVGINIDGLQEASMALMGISIVSKAVAAALAAISAAGGVKQALGGLMSSIGGPVGAAIAVALSAVIFGASELSKHEAEKKKYLEGRKEDKKRSDEIDKNWEDTGLGYMVPKQVNGENLYDVYVSLMAQPLAETWAKENLTS
jgi:hypothetical protein